MVKVLRKTGAKKTPGNQHRVVLMKVGDGNKGGSGKNVETGASRPKGNDSTRREPKKKNTIAFYVIEIVLQGKVRRAHKSTSTPSPESKYGATHH